MIITTRKNVKNIRSGDYFFTNHYCLIATADAEYDNIRDMYFVTDEWGNRYYEDSFADSPIELSELFCGGHPEAEAGCTEEKGCTDMEENTPREQLNYLELVDMYMTEYGLDEETACRCADYDTNPDYCADDYDL